MPAVRAEVRFQSASESEGHVNREAVSSAALGGILYKTGTAVLVVSFRAVFSSTIHELISVQRVSVGLAHFATAASRQVALLCHI